MQITIFRSHFMLFHLFVDQVHKRRKKIGKTYNLEKSLKGSKRLVGLVSQLVRLQGADPVGLPPVLVAEFLSLQLEK